jgi:hypothetical protein
MKDKPALIVFFIVLFCLIVLLCLYIIAAIFPGYPISRTIFPLPVTASTTISSSTTSIPGLELTVLPKILMKGVEAHIHIQMTNPGKLDLQDYSLHVWYSAENDLGGVVIQSIPLSSEVGEVFEKDITWYVDDIPDNRNYEVRLVLLKPNSPILTETSVAIEFVEPTLVVSIAPTQLTPNSAATIHIQVNNPSGADMHDYKLLVGYATKGDTEMFTIRDIPLSLEAGGVFEQDIHWDERYVPSNGKYELRVWLILPDGAMLAEIKTPFTLSDR